MCKFTKGRSEEWLKRNAAQIAAQLPENKGEALAVLTLAREIIVNLGSQWEGCDNGGQSCPVSLRLVASDPE